MEFDKRIKIEPSSPRGTGHKPDAYYSVNSLGNTEKMLGYFTDHIAEAIEDDEVTDEDQIIAPDFGYSVQQWQRVFEHLKIARGLLRTRIAIQQQYGLSAVQDKEILVRESDSYLNTY